MKAYKLEFGTYDGEGQWDQTFLTKEDVIEAYNKTKDEYKDDDTFEEYPDENSFGVDGINCEWYEIEVKEKKSKTSNKPLVYLACPYSGNEEENFKLVSKKAAELLNQGMTIFSPIAMCHPMAIYGKLPGNWEFWEKFDRAYISCCNKLIVYRLKGWDTSKGVTAEVKIAQEMGIPVEYID